MECGVWHIDGSRSDSCVLPVSHDGAHSRVRTVDQVIERIEFARTFEDAPGLDDVLAICAELKRLRAELDDLKGSR